MEKAPHAGVRERALAVLLGLREEEGDGSGSLLSET